MNQYSPIVAVLVTLSVIVFILHSRFGGWLQDVPNARSLHAVLVPRSGGIAIWAGILSGWALVSHAVAWWLLSPLIILFCVSLLDDVRGLPVRPRLLSQFIAASLMLAGSGFLAQQGLMSALVMLLFTVWLTNLYNFMDGADGLAGGMTLFGFSCYGAAALLAQNDAMAMLSLSVGAAALGFLCFNFPPAKMFMGDVGSIPLGFLVAALGLWGWQQDCWPVWFPLLVFSPFLVDASVTLARRTWRGARITEAHREHYYQRAIRMGRTHREVALVEYMLMLGCGGTALLALHGGYVWQVMAVWVCIYTSLMLPLDAAWKRHEREQHA
ncbi:MAG: glycosyltransferase family 4 protein [Gammaproteobacteria bacterium]|nr:glycosyltransferase family 4 protein [Gammaproteobacteria bacterium]MBU1624045.1 glycosyltransferase family 4 protein [Gammaproteobacteria bacterium]MBU1981773.1 glycosyltransferase family 4 protein [Gammaproteobacteria bacterium]